MYLDARAEESPIKDDKTLEQHLVIAKMNWANAELKIDNMKGELKSCK